MAKTNTAKATFSDQEKGGKNMERESYGDLPAKGEGCQEWPSYSGGPKRGAGMPSSKSGDK